MSYISLDFISKMGKSIATKESQPSIKEFNLVYFDKVNIDKSIDVKEEQSFIILVIVDKLWGPDLGKMTDSNFEQDWNIHSKFPVFDRLIFERSIDCNDEHSWNKFCILTTFVRLSGKETDSNEVQDLNIKFRYVSFVRLQFEKSIDFNDEQLENAYSIVSKFCRFSGKVTDSNKVQPSNIKSIEVTLDKSAFEKSIDFNAMQLRNILEVSGKFCVVSGKITISNFEHLENIYFILVTFGRSIFERSIDTNDVHSENIYSISSTLLRFFGRVTDFNEEHK